MTLQPTAEQLTLARLVRQLAATQVAEMPITALPYAEFLGLHARVSDDVLIMRMPYKLDLIGHPQPARLHGGTIGGLLETTGALAVARALALKSADFAALSMPKPINITLDYVRAGGAEDSFAAAEITRMGRRVANVRAEAWQADRARLITTAHMNVLIS